MARHRPRVLLVDSIAFAQAARTPLRGARVVALAHMRVTVRIARALVTRADRVVAVGPALARELRATGARSVTIVRPGCDRVPVLPRSTRAHRTLRVLCVANWSRVKGVDTLLDAAARADGVDVELVGDATDTAYARSLRTRIARLAPRVVVHGPLGPRALARAFARADVVAVPSRAEGYGIAASEAIAHGLPVVASDIPALRAIVRGCGPLVRPDDVPGLARALASLRDARARRRYERAARIRARRLPRWSEVERSFVSLLVREMRVSGRGGDRMPPRGVKSPERKRQYEHIKKSELSRGRSNKTAERIAAATTNKTRRKKGETKSRRKTSSRKKKS